MPYYNRDPKRDHNFDNHPYIPLTHSSFCSPGKRVEQPRRDVESGRVQGLGFRVFESGRNTLGVR